MLKFYQKERFDCEPERFVVRYILFVEITTIFFLSSFQMPHAIIIKKLSETYL